MAKKLVVEELTQESFKDFGVIISAENKAPNAEDDNFGWWEGLAGFTGIADVSINVLRAKKREFKVDKLEYHKETPEAVIPIGGKAAVLVVAPAGVLDEGKIKAFYLDGSKSVLLDNGVRHFIPYPIDGDADCVVVFKGSTGANDLIMEQLSDTYEIVEK